MALAAGSTLLATAAAGCSLMYDPQIPMGDGPPPIEGTIDVGYLYVGPIGDHGWTKTHDDARLYLEENVPDVATHYAPSVAAADAASVIDDFVARGDDVIIGTSFDFLQAITNAALRYPDRRFLICSGFQTGPNLGSYFGRMELAIYQAGVLAGRMTRSGVIGLVGPVVIPESVRHINAFARGVRSVNPEARLIVRWTYSWFDPDEETDATNELVDAGADIIFGQTDTPVPIQVSATRMAMMDGGPVYSIGYDNADSCTFAPDRCLTSAYWNWGPMMTRIIESMRDGTWDPSEIIYDQMEPDRAESVVYLAPIDPSGPVPTSVRVEVETLVAELTRDTPESRYYPFRGPVLDNAGATRIPAGSVPDDDALLRMCWYTEGIYDLDGTTPAEVPAGCVGDR